MGDFFAGERMEDDLRWREERERRLAAKKEAHADEVDAVVNDADEFQEKDDEDIYFAPEKGNVIFASAVDGWGFRVAKFAHLYAVKLGMNETNLRTVLWGDFYLDPKTKKVISYKHLRGRALKPLFVQFVLENIWAVYDAVVQNPYALLGNFLIQTILTCSYRNPDKVTKIVGALNLKIAPRDLRAKETRQLLSLIFTQWLSLSTCVIQSIVDVVPPPSTAQGTRIPKMLYPDLYESVIPPKNRLEEDLYSCNADPSATVTALISKMFAVPQQELPEHKKKPVTADELRAKAKAAREARKAAEAAVPDSGDIPLEEALEQLQVKEASEEVVVPEGEVLLGFARIYSGTIKTGTAIACVLPKYNNSYGPTHPKNEKHVVITRVEGLYVMMGRELVPVETVQAGNVFAIRGLEGKVWRNATICAPSENGVGEVPDLEQLRDSLVNLGGVHRMVGASTPTCFHDLTNLQAAPIVRVALEPELSADMPKLISGLKLLAQADPCVETFQQQTGEHVILTAGELHLEVCTFNIAISDPTHVFTQRCLKDLRERFAKIEIHASKPIVPFRETTVRAPDMAPPKSGNVKRGTMLAASSLNLVKTTIRAAPLPKDIWDFLRDNLALLRRMQQDHKSREENNDHVMDDSRNLDGQNLEDIEEDEVDLQGEVIKKPTIKAEEFWKVFREVCAKAGGEWTDLTEKLWAFGPQRAGTCVLVDSRAEGQTNS